MSSPCRVFKTGNHAVKLITVLQNDFRSSAEKPPPKPLLVSTPCEEDEFPVLIFLHGFVLYNSFYSQLLQHISSHGFIVVAPQLYTIAGPDCSEEISDAAKTTDWLIKGLAHVLPNNVRPNFSKVAIAGHSRGGKVAFALALGYAKPSLTFSALMAVDPVDGMDKGKQTNPPILTYIPHSFELKMAALVIGSGLGGLKKNLFFPPCAPEGVSHQSFFDECKAPACHLVAKDYGHLDVLDDETKGIRGKATYCLCAKGKAREPMRNFVGGVMVAFMRAYLDGNMEDLWTLRDDPEHAIPIVVSIACFKE
ncbi:chlorophyllase-2, chloroplastic [Phalaenopsis equestris]|uniref:chlorophyllase-2, chloroplastic n=1 Tax=Phalaenopsis equestris TaxID=78828 RepID=UPI0009E20833|nr:chlorophyllase-2, chloroplastic [Phalaenopsis equestris]